MDVPLLTHEVSSDLSFYCSKFYVKGKGGLKLCRAEDLTVAEPAGSIGPTEVSATGCAQGVSLSPLTVR